MSPGGDAGAFFMSAKCWMKRSVHPPEAKMLT
jgi:hypothetical protein